MIKTTIDKKSNCHNICRFILFIFLLLFSFFTQESKGQIVINELGIAPTSGNAGSGGEFIELYNKGGCSVDISCYILVYSGTSNTGSSNGWTTTIPSGTILQPCEFFLIGGSGNTSGAFNFSWNNVANGGTGWINTSGTNGNSTANLDLSSSSAKNSSKLSVPGNLNDAKGQVSLFTSMGVLVWSVSYNTGNNSASYPAIPNSTGCAGGSSITDPGQSINDVTGNSFESGAPNRQRGIYLDANGSYQTETTFTPGKSNAMNGGSQLCCAPAIATDDAASNVCYSTLSQTTTLAYTSTTDLPITYSITWNTSPANNFVDVNVAALPASPITINIPAATAPGTYTGNIKVSNSGGCSSCTRSFTVTVFAKPTITVSPSNPAICPGASVTLTASGASTYTWSPATGLSTASGVSVIASPTSTTTYTVTGTDANGCSNTDQITVTVNPKPSPIIYHN